METKFSNDSKLMERKPILDKPYRISSQDTVITSTCQCLVPHKVSDFSNSGGLFGSTSCELSITPSSMCQKHDQVNENFCDDYKTP
jgi:hypothetical protein